MKVDEKMHFTGPSSCLCATCVQNGWLFCARQDAEEVTKASGERVSCEDSTVGVLSTRFNVSNMNWRHIS